LARQSNAPLVEECDAGLVKLVVPIFLGEAFLGVIGGCGHLLEDGEVDTFMINRTTGIAEEELARLAEGIARIGREEIDSLIRFIRQEIDTRLEDYLRRQPADDPDNTI
jgi:ligand-binding sensor protein